MESDEKHLERLKRYRYSVIYLIGSKHETDLPVKVGRTDEKNLQRRLAALQTGCPYELSVLASFRGGPGVETHLHRMLKNAGLHIHGEWFRMPQQYFDFITDPECCWSFCYD